MAIEVTRADPPHRLTATVTGEDEHLKSRVRGTLDASLVQVATSTEPTLRTTVDVLGRVATLGHSAIRRRVQERLTEMEKRIRAALGPGLGLPPFDLHEPTTIEEASRLLGQFGKLARP